MFLSIIFAWISVLLAIMCILKFIARICGNPTLNSFFRKVHIPFGVLLLITGLIHGILAGNNYSATLLDFQIAPVLFTINFGTISFVISIALAVTYLLRKKLKRKWMISHRILTVAMILCITIHLFDIGIQLPERLFGQSERKENLNDSYYNESLESSIVDGDTSSNSDAVIFSGAKLKDGKYQGSANGYKSKITVSVIVADGKVTEINVDSENETANFFNNAKTILSEIKKQQSLEVDGVSGATYSSKGLIDAVYDALGSAVISGELKVNNINISSGKKR